MSAFPSFGQQNAGMGQSDRVAAVQALVALSRSSDFLNRQDAGVAFARLADSEIAATRLRELILDPEDTSVTRTTLEALTRRGDEIGLAIIATALTSADDNHADWVASGVADGLAMSESARRQTLGICQQLEDRRSRATQRGVLALRAMLADAGPIH